MTWWPRLRPPPLPVAAAGWTAALFAAFDLLDAKRMLWDRPYGNDFRLFYSAARVGVARGWSHLYDLQAQSAAVTSLGPGFYWSPFINPPPMAWLALPFTTFPFRPALLLWTAFVAAGLLLAWSLAAPGDGWARLAYLLLALGLFPVAFGILIGQTPALVAAAAAGCWWLLTRPRRRSVWAGVVLGVMALKPQTALLVPPALLAAGYWRTFTACAAVAGALALVSAVALGTAGIADYLYALSIASTWELTQRYAVAGVIGVGPQLVVAQVAAVAVTLGAAWRHRAGGPELPIAVGLVGSLLFTRYIGIQDLTVLLVAAWLTLRAEPPLWLKVLLLAGVLPVELALVLGPVPLIAWETALLIGLATAAGNRFAVRRAGSSRPDELISPPATAAPR